MEKYVHKEIVYLQFTVTSKFIVSILVNPMMVLVATQEYRPELCRELWEIVSVDSTVNNARKSM